MKSRSLNGINICYPSSIMPHHYLCACMVKCLVKALKFFAKVP